MSEGHIDFGCSFSLWFVMVTQQMKILDVSSMGLILMWAGVSECVDAGR